MDPKARVDPLVPGAFLFAQVFIPGETLTQRPLPLSELQYSDQPDEEVTNVVAPGRPVGQMYGLGGVDFLDKAELCGEGSKCAQTEGSGWNRFTVGPPLFVHMSDLHGVANPSHSPA